MRLQMGRVDHQRIGASALIGQFKKHPGEDTLLTPALPPAVERLVRPALRRRIPPAQAVAIDEDYAAQHSFVVHTRLAVRLRKNGLQLGHLCIAQPVKIAHVTAPFSEPRITRRSRNQCIRTLVCPSALNLPGAIAAGSKWLAVLPLPEDVRTSDRFGPRLC